MPAKKGKRDDTTKQADRDAANNSIAKLRTLRADLKSGNGNANQRIARCEDAIAALIRAYLVMTGVADSNDRQ